MTPVAKKATAAELREAFIIRCSCDQEVHDDSRADFVADLDRLLAAARAEAVADAGDDAVELREALLSLSARPDDPNRPHINDIIGACIRAARAEAVAPLEARVAELESERGALVEADILRRARVGEVLDVLRQFAEAMPKCDRCGAPAFSECYQYPRPSPIPYCPLCGPESGRHKLPHQDPLRAALALLAADQADEKAGKP